jgi:hypothetical protein
MEGEINTRIGEEILLDAGFNLIIRVSKSMVTVKNVTPSKFNVLKHNSTYM